MCEVCGRNSLTVATRMNGHGVVYCLKIFGVKAGVETWWYHCHMQESKQNCV